MSERSLGCHCDLEPGQQPTGCVFDGHEPVENCSVAMRLRAEGKSQAQCEHWSPVQPSEVEQLRAEVERLRLRLRLTELEKADLEMWREECCHQSRTATAAGEVECAERWAARADRTLALLARLGGDK